MTVTEAERLLSITEGRWLYGLIYTAIATGMRESELIGLRWNNVMLTDTPVELRVVEQYKVVRGQGRWQSTKNRKKRTIEGDRDLAEVVRAQQRLVAARRADPEAMWATPEHNLVFPSEVGTPLNQRNLVRSFKKLLAQANIPDMRFHDLCHTAGSLLLAHGATMTEVSEILGHSSVEVTQRIYAHAYGERKRDAIAGLGRILRGTDKRCDA
jgi:integrase